ncbi:hypothetical protein [Oceanicoccus sp. KOV_DT_Chl]|uniref:hypothetical protein n=1 Tax=Oceanicoccus sp. KOV_DT_Chl TaxID=1904639 RepID=UPI000C7AD2F4|nr:hypothetical protein [Oceanicoccus sp. KOV_DT_Chl]
MKLFKTVFITLLSAVTLFSFNAVAELQTKDTATLTVIRGAESTKTRSTNFNVYLGSESLARFKVNTAKTFTVAAGETVIYSNFYKDKPLKIELQPGKNYYILATMKKGVNKLTSVYELITEDYALSVAPELSDTASSI